MLPHKGSHLSLLLLVWLPQVSFIWGCTNILITRGASIDGSSMIAYNADSGDLFGYVYHYPAQTTRAAAAAAATTTSETKSTKATKATKATAETIRAATEEELRQIYDWDSGVYLGAIPEAPSTYNVVGNTNEKGLTIAETTFGGVEVLSHQPGAILDYGSLIYIALQRCATAREAIETMTTLMNQYGYASEGESFSLSDSTTGEVWMMEVIGKGKAGTGAVWVALRIPDGAVAAHANQARIQQFPRNDPENCLYAQDVVDFAVQMGLYTRQEGDFGDSLFSFSDVYNPITYSGARHCDARVWSIFSQIMGSDFQHQYEAYASGQDLTNRMPLYIYPPSSSPKISLQNVDLYMSSHYEDTTLAMDQDVGAGEFAAPYRTRPLVWQYKDEAYANERPIATQQTGWNFIAQMRPYTSNTSSNTSSSLNDNENIPHKHNTHHHPLVPQYLSSILWFGVDDSSTSPRVPIYGCSTRISTAYAGKGPQDGIPSPLTTLDLTKAFWVQNMVSNFVYSRWYTAYPILKERRSEWLQQFQIQVKETDDMIREQYGMQDIANGIEAATKFTVIKGDEMHNAWFEFYGELFVQFRDFFHISETTRQNDVTSIRVQSMGFREEWKERIVNEAGERYKVPKHAHASGNDHSSPHPPSESPLENGNGGKLRGFQVEVPAPVPATVDTRHLEIGVEMQLEKSKGM